MRSEFMKRFTDALRRRLYPNTGLRVDDLAYALGMNGFTLRAWLRGESCPGGDAVDGCIDFFTRAGDHNFLQELYPKAVTPLIQRRKAADAALALVQSMKGVFRELDEVAA